MASVDTKLRLLSYLEECGLGKHEMDLAVLNAISNYIEKIEKEQKSPISFKNTYLSEKNDE